MERGKGETTAFSQFYEGLLAKKNSKASHFKLAEFLAGFFLRVVLQSSDQRKSQGKSKLPHKSGGEKKAYINQEDIFFLC